MAFYYTINLNPTAAPLWRARKREKRKNKWDDFEEGKEVLEKGTAKGKEARIGAAAPVDKEIKAGRERPQGDFTSTILSLAPSLQAKKKILFTLSILSKLPAHPPLPVRGNPRRTLAQKTTFDAAQPPQLLARPTQTPTRHTRQTRRQALAPATPVLRAPGPGRISLPSPLPPPSEAASPPTRLRHPEDPSLLHLPPEASAPPSSLRRAARSRREAGTPEAEE